MNKFLTFITFFLIVSCGGGGSSSPADSGSRLHRVHPIRVILPVIPLILLPTSNSQDSAANIVNQTGCTPLVTGSNEADNDADGVINLFDICPNNQR